MTIAFTSIMAIFIIERVDERAGAKSLAPLVIAGALSILYWRQVISSVQIFPPSEYFHFAFKPSIFTVFTLCSYFDDLRPYAVVQFVPCIAIPVMAIVIPPMYTHSSYWLWAAGLWDCCSMSMWYTFFWKLYLRKRVRTLYVGGANHGICKVMNSSIALRQSGSQQGELYFFPPDHVYKNRIRFFSPKMLSSGASCPLKTNTCIADF